MGATITPNAMTPAPIKRFAVNFMTRDLLGAIAITPNADFRRSCAPGKRG
jgi:hypothetical protein